MLVDRRITAKNLLIEYESNFDLAKEDVDQISTRINLIFYKTPPEQNISFVQKNRKFIYWATFKKAPLNYKYSELGFIMEGDKEFKPVLCQPMTANKFLKTYPISIDDLTTFTVKSTIDE